MAAFGRLCPRAWTGAGEQLHHRHGQARDSVRAGDLLPSRRKAVNYLTLTFCEEMY